MLVFTMYYMKTKSSNTYEGRLTRMQFNKHLAFLLSAIYYA